ncbi:EAL domain-containing protein [Paucibacter sp. PLA-PC-4]|uniref:putative bifunctional diguanylate cyclase/phosphodiesterase n=1 Tax=Paucibacter sp. PLA-PC-4 TaxID=2993655 RepID=UPI002248F363|nr:GGDEF and EAL domain-containing protein [Paucibacter sp. PLA-PC-4]MCX2862434.1 EAL domain-containing protein [Paucibacter sp. PLA-PC-4]
MVDPHTGLPLSLAQVGQLIDLLPDGVLIIDGQGLIVCANAALAELSGREPQALLGQPLALLLPPEQRARHLQHIGYFFAEPRSRAMGRVQELSLWHSEDRAVPVDISLGRFCSAEGDHALAVIRDISQIQAMHAQARYLAMHDKLTGLYSRHMFGELLAQAVEHTRRSGQPMAVLLIDLDDFKAVNDGHGHHVGDALLKEVARRMRAVLRGCDALARLGGDEFAVLLREQADVVAATTVAHKLVEAISRPWQFAHQESYPGASIGVVFAPNDGEDAETLLRRADMAMYRAKEAGRGTYAVFDLGMARQMEERVLLQGRLKKTLDGTGLRLHYQAQLCAVSGRVVGVEALLRWHDAELGEVAPARFIAVAESSGLIQGLGDWVMDAACRQIALWRGQGLALRVAVNVSVHQLRQPGFADRIQGLLERWQLPPALLELEITETAAMTHHDQAQAQLERVAALGVQLALDDFGTGYSSLSHLRQMPVSRLKMDRDFIQGITHNPQDAVLARAIIGLAKTLGKTVVAEGVETAAQQAFLQQQGCDELQGWLFARALPAEEIPALVRRFAVPCGLFGPVRQAG